MAVCLDQDGPRAEDDDSLQRAELHAALHEELGRLPEKYRAPLVLCYVEGLTHEAAARQLGWPLGTVRVRIARGRDRLGARLTRRGLTPAAVLIALGLLPKGAAAVPVRLVEATMRTAARVEVGEKGPREKLPARVADLEKKVKEAMKRTRLKWTTAFALAVVVTGAGVAAVVPRALAAADDKAKAEAELNKLRGTWLIAAFEKAGERKQGEGNEEQIKIEDETFSIWHDGHVEEKGRVQLDPSKDPTTIDFHFVEGRHAGKTDLAIYAWDGANLKLCWVIDRDHRPTDFTTKADDRRVLLILKRPEP
jgi:RNA polymerase sigma-70 factor (ECF subfamily)